MMKNNKFKIIIISIIILTFSCISPSITSKETKKIEEDEPETKFFIPFQNRTIFALCHINSSGVAVGDYSGGVFIHLSYTGYNVNSSTTITNLMGFGNKQKTLTGDHDLIVMGFLGETDLPIKRSTIGKNCSLDGIAIYVGLI